MKILLTGASGFLGSHLAKAFVNSGYEVHALIRKETKLSRLEGYENKLIFHSRESGLDKAFDKNNPYSAVVHTATCYGRNGEKDTEVFDANLRFPLELLETADAYNTEKFLNTDTFFNTGSIKYSYLNSYALSKKQFVEWGREFSRKRDIIFCNIKVEHMYGPDDDGSKFTSHIFSSCINNIPVIKLTPGEQKRDFIYIDDVVSAYQLLLKSNDLSKFETFELGTGLSISIRDFVETVHAITGSKSILEFSALPYRENEIMESKAQTEKLRKRGWEPQFDLLSALRRMLELSKG